MMLDPELKAFQAEVRAFCREQLPKDIKRKVDLSLPVDRDDHARWHQILHAKGWMGAHWPRQYGGQEFGPLKRWVLEQTLAEGGAPWLIPMGVAYVGPVLYTFGTDAQKARFLPAILTAGEFWAQGYSEPNAGSDLAGLKTRADRAGDHYVVNGQKTWTTYAQWADWMFCLVRTDSTGRPQQGVSFLLIDMHAPGVSVRPIATMDGKHHINEVFLENVEVPVENRVGEEGQAWTYAKFLLVQERLIAAETGRIRHLMSMARCGAATVMEAGRPLVEQAWFCRRYAEVEIELRALEAVCLRLLGQAERVGLSGVEVNLLKIRGSEIEQAATELMVSICARRGLPFAVQAPGRDCADAGGRIGDMSGMLSEFLYLRAATIYGGSNEIQRGIIAKQGLKL